jgi:hypothetical protein
MILDIGQIQPLVREGIYHTITITANVTPSN